MVLIYRHWIGAILLGLFSVLLYSINLERLANHDEFYHMLAAEGVLATGAPTIGNGGVYWRGFPLTWLVAQSFSLFGSSLTAARLPSVIMVAALVIALFLFLRREAGPLAAWLGASLFAISPFAISIAQFVRFYGMQCLLFFIGAWIVYHLIKSTWRTSRDLPLALLAAALFVFAAYLQETTLLGLAGVGAWTAGAVLLPLFCSPTVRTQMKLRIFAALVAVALVGLGAAWLSGLLDALWTQYRSVPRFNEPAMNRFWSYHAWYQLYYPTVWTLSGVIAIFALVERPRLASFLIVVFGVGFLLNSFAAAKSLRYIAYVQPFLFALWGVGLAAIFGLLPNVVARLRDRLAEHLTGLAGQGARALATLFLIVAVLFTVVVNPAWVRSVTMLADIVIPPQAPRPDWLTAKPTLAPWLERVDVVVTTDELGPLYYYDRADVLLHASKFYEIGDPQRRPFDPDPRTAVPTIAHAEDLARVIDCYASGLFITLAQWWSSDGVAVRDHMRDPEVEQLVLSRAEPLDLPRASHVVAYVWQHPPNHQGARDCGDLPLAPFGP